MQVFVSSLEDSSIWPARLMMPLPYDYAQSLSESQQLDLAQKMLEDSWFHGFCDSFEVLKIRTPHSWGKDFFLYKNSMNPVMTAQFMRKGRIPHKSKTMKGLYLTGSSTHPGQWVSFCSISGILAADILWNDYAS